MASTFFDSLSDDLNWLEKNSEMSDLLKKRSKFFRTFVRLAKKWRDHMYFDYCDNETASLVSFCFRIEDAVHKHALHMDSLCLQVTKVTFLEILLIDAIYNLQKDVLELFFPVIEQVYATSSDCSTMRFPPPAGYDLVEFIASLPLLLEDLLIFLREEEEEVIAMIEELEEKLSFLKNFIRFAILRGVEQKELEDLLIDTEVVVVKAAPLIFMCWNYQPCTEILIESKCDISELLQKIKHIHFQVCETYIQVLKPPEVFGSSKILDPDDHVVGEFINSLLGNFWEIIRCNTSFTFFEKNQMKSIYEGLRFLRTILREQQEKFNGLDQNSNNLIEVLVGEAGIVICSLFVNKVKAELAKEMYAGISYFLENIKLFKAEIAKKYKLASSLSFPRTNEIGFIGFLQEKLKELIETGSIALAKDHIQIVHEDLPFLRSFLEDIFQRHNEHEDIQTLWSRITEVAYKVEFVIDSLLVEDIPDCSPMFDTIKEEIKLIKTEILEIYDDQKYGLGAQEVAKIYNNAPSQASNPTINEDVVGFDDEAETIINQLTRGSAKLDIVSIVGMPGLGKTTLANKIFHDPSVISHFHIRSWSCVSQEYNKKKLLLDILTNVLLELPGRYSMMIEDDLVEQLYKCLKGKRYLIVLDDVWDLAVWTDLERLFPDDANGSRILFTSRLHNVAMQEQPDSNIHLLRPLTDAKSWELLQKKLFHKEGCPSPLCELGMEIAKRCKGLPLTIVIVAGILVNMEKDHWQEVVGSLSSGGVCGTEECLTTLELSYKHLPQYLKPCLLYFGVFREDQEIPIQRLIRLWIAEGFVQKSDLKSLEDVAQDYIMDLIGRSLILVSKYSSRGGVKSCCIHDLLHQFCLAKLKEENFVKLLKGCDELFNFYEPGGLRRLCIYSDQEHLRKSRLFCPDVRSLLFFDNDFRFYRRNLSNIFIFFRISKFLSVLDLGKINLGKIFPTEIELLVQLRYLAVHGDMHFLPPSIANLQNLETLLVVGLLDVIRLPDTIWNMKKLRHLHVSLCSFSLPNDNIENLSSLHNLDTFSTPSLSFDPQMEMLLRKLPNIRRLSCRFENPWVSTRCRILGLDFLSRLESLKVFSSDWVVRQIEFRVPLNLKKLTLSMLNLPWTQISSFGKLPHLEVLKLRYQSVNGKVWNMEGVQFPKLRFLNLKSLNIVKWIASTGEHFPQLQQLILQRCEQLEEIPACFGEIPTLQMIEVRLSSETAASSAQRIQEEQMNMGNGDLKIFIHPPGRDSVHSY